MSILQPAQNAGLIGTTTGRAAQPAISNTSAQTPGAPALFGRPSWTYVSTMAGPVRGPQPRLSRGSGHTGNTTLPGNAPQLPGYLSDNEYYPTLFTYDSLNKPGFLQRIPRSIPVGENGREMVGTYQPHDFTPGTRFLNHMRQAPAWQIQEYPPDNRQLLIWQQARKYRTGSFTKSPAPLSSSNYFVGYQIDPAISANMGQSTMGYMGSS